jgi:FixJ family two-component response regulator
VSRFTLSILPDGRAVLTTERRLDLEQAQQLQEAVKGWREGRWPVLVIPECATVQVADLALELGAVDLTPSPAEIRHEQLLEGVR